MSDILQSERGVWLKNERSIVYLFFAFLSFFFLLFHSVTTSPLWIGAHLDSEVFILLGKFFLRGKIPYVDYFDHKGPIIIFIEAIGQSLHPDRRMGIFILQSVFLTFLLCFLYTLFRRYLNKSNSMIVVFSTLCYLAIVFQNGNLTEEYSLPFIFIPAWYAIRFILDRNYSIKPSCFIIIGACAGVLIWIRLNNAAVVLACVLLFFTNYFVDRNYSGICKLIGYTLLGVLLVSFPILFYFHHIGALQEMLYATFTFNFEYAKNANEFEANDNLTNLLLIRLVAILSLPFIVLLIGTVVYYRKSRQKKVILFTFYLLIFCLLATMIGKKSPQYFMITLPLVSLGVLYLVLALKDLTNRTRYSILCGIIMIFSCLTALKIIQNRHIDDEEIEYRKNVFELMGIIPQDEWNQIYSYRTSHSFIDIAELNPYFRYFISQERHGAIDSKIYDSINQMMINNPPKWLVIEYKVKSLHNPSFFEVRDEKFNLYFENDMFELYKLK